MVNAALANKGRFTAMKAFFDGVGEWFAAGVWEDVPQERPEFREHHKRQIIKIAKKRKAEEMEEKKELSALRAELKKNNDYVGLTMLPRNSSRTRCTNRCLLSGRRHAFIRRFKLSRIAFRELANAGMIPGVTKSSW